MLKPKPKILSFILIAIMLAAALGGLCLATDTAEAAPIEFSSSALPASGTLMQASSTWAATRDASTGSVLSQTVYMAQASIQAGYDPIIARSLFWFDLSVSNSFTLNGVSLSLTPRGVWDSVGSTKLLFLIPSGSVGTTLDGNDYSRTLYTGGVACEIPLSSLTDGVTSSFALTAAGKSYINSIQDRSAVPLYMVVSSDYHNSPPPAGGNVGADFEGYSTVKLVYNFEAPTTYVWDGGGSTNLASDRYNWDKNIAPQPGSDVRYDATSVKSCTWDLDASVCTVKSLTLSTGYAGTLAQGNVDMGIGTGGYLQQGGTFSGKNSQWVRCDGSFVVNGGTVSGNSIRLDATGTGQIKAFTAYASRCYSISISGQYSLGANMYVNGVSDTLTVSGRLDLSAYEIRCYESAPNVNIGGGGMVSATTGYIALLASSDKTLSINVDMSRCKLELENLGTDGSTLTIKQGNSWTIQSLNLMNTGSRSLVLDMNGKSLNVPAVNLKPNNGLSNSGAAAACTVSGAFTVNGAGATVSGPIALDCHSLSITAGTFDQGNADIVIGAGGLSMTGGTLSGQSGYRIICSGDMIKTGGSYTSNDLSVTMRGTVTLAWEQTYTARLASLWFDGDVTISGTLNIMGLKGIAGSISGSSLLNIYYIGSILPADAPVNIHCPVMAKTTYTINNFDPLNYRFDDLTLDHINTDEGATRYVYIRQPFSGSVTSSSIPNLVTSMTVRVVMQTDLVLDTLMVNGGSTTRQGVFDTNGHNLTADGIRCTLGGSIVFGSMVTNYGDLDTSSGVLIAGISKYMQAGDGTIKLGAGQSFYDLTVTEGVTATLGSDVEVTHYAVIYGSVVRGDYILTLAHIINSYPQLTLEKFDNYLYRINIVPGAQLTMLEYPSWLTWNPHQLTLSGKAVQAGTFNVRIMAEFPGGQQEYQNYTVTVSGLPPTPGWSGGQPLTDYGSIMLYIVVGAAIAFILLVLSFMRRR